MIFRGQGVRVALGLVAVTVLASSCSGGARTGAAPSPVAPTAGPTSPTTGATGTGTGRGGSTATAPDEPWRAVPAAARPHTNAAAQAFAEFYLEQLNRSWRQADPSLLQPFATASCKTCTNFIATASSMRSNKQRYASDAAQVLSSAWLPNSLPDDVRVSVVTMSRAVTIVDVNGRVVERVPEDRGAFLFRLIWQRGGWVVASIQREVAP